MTEFNNTHDLSQQLANLSIASGSSSAPRRNPVDEYFYQHAAARGAIFTYNPDANLNIRKTFNRLAKAQEWKEKKRQQEKEKFFEAIDEEFTRRFGDGNDLQTWQKLVVMFGYVDDMPTSITKCRKILSRHYINIYDFLHYLRRIAIGPDDGAQEDLRAIDKGSLAKLRQYSKSHGLLYPLDFARGTVLKAFLVHMFG